MVHFIPPKVDNIKQLKIISNEKYDNRNAKNFFVLKPPEQLFNTDDPTTFLKLLQECNINFSEKNKNRITSTLSNSIPGYIYILRGNDDLTNWYKIGRTNNLERRQKEWNYTCVWYHETFHASMIEELFKKYFDCFRCYRNAVRGFGKYETEWFYCPLVIIKKTISSLIRIYDTNLFVGLDYSYSFDPMVDD